ncbi:MAG: hypothetical protein U0X39_08520 [Bacteroidales bacterium]
MNKHILLILLAVFTVSCQKEKITIDPDNLLLGTWQYSDYSGDMSVYTRNESFDKDKPGYTFKPDGTLVERKNSGFCGTPPITYADYDGTWVPESDSVILVNVGYWGGQMTYRLKIADINEHSLYVRHIYSEQ